MDRSHAARRKRSLRHALSADVDATVHHMVGRGLPRVLTREYFNKIFNFMDRPTITRSDVEALCRSVEKAALLPETGSLVVGMIREQFDEDHLKATPSSALASDSSAISVLRKRSYRHHHWPHHHHGGSNKMRRLAFGVLDLSDPARVTVAMIRTVLRALHTVPIIRELHFPAELASSGLYRSAVELMEFQANELTWHTTKAAVSRARTKLKTMKVLGQRVSALTRSGSSSSSSSSASSSSTGDDDSPPPDRQHDEELEAEVVAMRKRVAKWSLRRRRRHSSIVKAVGLMSGGAAKVADDPDRLDDPSISTSASASPGAAPSTTPASAAAAAAAVAESKGVSQTIYDAPPNCSPAAATAGGNAAPPLTTQQPSTLSPRQALPKQLPRTTPAVGQQSPKRRSIDGEIYLKANEEKKDAQRREPPTAAAAAAAVAAALDGLPGEEKVVAAGEGGATGEGGGGTGSGGGADSLSSGQQASTSFVKRIGASIGGKLSRKSVRIKDDSGKEDSGGGASGGDDQMEVKYFLEAFHAARAAVVSRGAGGNPAGRKDGAPPKDGGGSVGGGGGGGFHAGRRRSRGDSPAERGPVGGGGIAAVLAKSNWKRFSANGDAAGDAGGGASGGSSRSVVIRAPVSHGVIKRVTDLSLVLSLENARLEALSIFAEIDQDDSGFIETREMLVTLRKHGTHLRKSEVRHLFTAMGSNDRDRISRDRFVEMLVAASRKQATIEQMQQDLAVILPSGGGLIHPNSRPMQLWDGLIVVLLVYLALWTPVEVAFLPATSDIGPLFIFNRCVDFVFLVDICLAFRLMYPQPRAKGWVTDRHAITMHYLKGWFAIDVISILPIYLLEILGEGYIDPSVRELATVFRLIKLTRILRIGRLLQRWRDRIKISFALQEVIKFFVIILCFCHWLGCSWMFVAKLGKMGNAELTWDGGEAYDRMDPGDLCELIVVVVVVVMVGLQV